MKNQELAKSIFDASYITGEFLLRSGKISNEYFDKYRFESNPKLLDKITDEMLSLIPKDTEILGALEMGGIPIATLLSLKSGLPVCFIRKKAKEYGTKNIAEGLDFKGKKMLLVEDVVTSGGQIILSANELRASEAIIEVAVCVIDRESGGVEALQKDNINLKALYTMSELKNAK